MGSRLVPPSIRQFVGKVHAEDYLKYRPEWPQGLVQKSINFLLEKTKPFKLAVDVGCGSGKSSRPLASHFEKVIGIDKSKPFKLAVDVGCGSGQSSRPLASHFEKVIGMDVSEAQIEVARSAANPKNVEFIVGSAERIPLPRHSVDFISCGSSFHWFDKEAFFKETDKVLKPSGCLAVYTYKKMYPWIDGGDNAKNERMKQVIDELYDTTIGQYFSDRVKHQEQAGALEVPYADSRRENAVLIRKGSTVGLYLNFVRTLSGYQNYIEQNTDGEDILARVKEQLLDILGASSDDTIIHQRGPVYMALGRKPDGTQ